VKIPSLIELIYELSKRGTTEAAQKYAESNDRNEVRLSVPVRGQTKLFFDAQSKHLNTSVAALTGTILDTIAAREIETVSLNAESITGRFHLLLKEHGLTIPAAAEVLRSLNITAGDMTDQKTLLNRLTTENLSWIADHFCVSYAWLSGKRSATRGDVRCRWYKAPVEAAKRLQELSREGSNIDLCIVRAHGSNFESADAKNDNHTNEDDFWFCPIVRIERRAGPRETYKTYEVWQTGRWNYEPLRQQIKMVVFFALQLRGRANVRVTVSGMSAPKQSLHKGDLMWSSIFSGNNQFDWHPDDYVEPDSAVAKDKDEWAEIVEGEYFRRSLNEFERLVSSVES
jgi:hypothetical protein